MVRQPQAEAQTSQNNHMTNNWCLWLHILGSCVELRLGTFYLALVESLWMGLGTKPTESFS